MRVSLLASNVVILGVILGFVLHSPHSSSQSASALLSNSQSSTVVNPLDQVSSADIALTVARLGSLPETTAINNQAQSQAADIAVAASSHDVVSKPQVVSTALKSSADIKDYSAATGDTIASIAAKFGITSDSLRWSNGLSGDTVAVGTKLVIPPVNGIVYTVNTGDTPDSLAAKFRANKDKIVAYNDAEIKGLTPGQHVIIPDGSLVPNGVAPLAIRNAAAATAVHGAFAWGIAPMYGSNGYDYGYCTWYVANRISVPSNWGNANTWAYYAPSSGWSVSKAPVAGAVAQSTAGAEGHVAVVEAVSDDGTMIKYSDMNGLAVWGRVGTTTDWVPASHFNNYIYR